ncbi:MAG: glycosyltransferase family 39 protein [Acidobacteria bacterium]|nr:glycosyltransferase family 39 protein [Acidobacteriota bacterium]
MTAAARSRVLSHLLVFTVIFGALLAMHAPYLQLPYFWDELGQFIPAALDILRDNAWVPHSTIPNVHPPAVMAYLALAWKLFGYSTLVTRVAMLLAAAAGVYFTFLLAIRLCRDVPGAPAFITVGFLMATPLFYMQAMLAQLDMPAMTLTALAFLLFYDRRYAWCALASTLLVLTKETGIAAPAVFGAWLLFHDRDWRRAAWFLLPAAALGAWLAILWHTTGYLLGDPGFAHYNVGYQLHPVRLAATLVRRVYYLFFADFRFLGLLVSFWAIRFARIYQRWEWTVAAYYVGGHLLLVTGFGGAALERYLLPVFPLLYLCMATLWAAVRPRLRYVSQITMLAGLFSGLYWNPPFPFPLENNLALIDFVELQKAGAEFLEKTRPGESVASAWPYTAGLRNPDLGFVQRGRRTVETSDFHADHVATAVRAGRPDLLVTYSRTWEPEWGALGNRLVRAFLTRYYDYEPQITSAEIEERFGMHAILRWEQRGQWIEIYSR